MKKTEKMIKQVQSEANKARGRMEEKRFEKTQEILSKPLEMSQIRSALPRAFRSHITEDFVKKLEESLTDPEMNKIIKENFLTYTNVLNELEPSTNIWEYVDAVKFISYKLMGYSIDEAYKRTFPSRVKDLIDQGKMEWVNKYANGYNKTKIVNKIYQQTLIPSYVLNAPLFQRALNELTNMLDDPSVRGMTRVKACEAILSYTKPPEVSKAEVQVNIKQSDAIADLRDIAEQFASQMKKAIEDGTQTVDEIIDADIISIKE